jgi:hypothetical protein
MVTQRPLTGRGRRALMKLGALLALAGGSILLLGGGTTEARAPTWGFHADWADYCFSYLERKVTRRVDVEESCLLWEQKVTGEAKIRRAAEAGAETIRINTSWTEGSNRTRPPPPGERYAYEWGRLDRLYETARRFGMRPIIVILDTPVWARRSGWQRHCANLTRLPCAYPPRRSALGSFQRWVEALMRRYPGALAIEVWNEPNAGRFWAPLPSPREYVRLLRRAHAARASSGFSGPVVLGGLAPAMRSGPRRMRDAQYLDGVYRHGRKDWFDGIGHHPYPFRTPGSATDGWVARMDRHLQRILRVRNRHGHRRAELWLTEIGVRGGGEGFEDRTVDRAHQGPILKRLYDAAARRPVRAVTFYTLADLPFEGPRWSHFGVVNPELHPKAAFCYLRRELGGLSPCDGGLPEASAEPAVAP